jgi:hypothetical protein
VGKCPPYFLQAAFFTQLNPRSALQFLRQEIPSQNQLKIIFAIFATQLSVSRSQLKGDNDGIEQMEFCHKANFGKTESSYKLLSAMKIKSTLNITQNVN